jgi:dephospho-CoA kinase
MTTEHRQYLKIGLTGGIGSGKTTAAKRFLALGARVYHADEISRRALDPGAVCYDRVVSAFGQEILREDGTIDRKRLGQIVFADAEKLQLLNGIIHPYVIDELFARAEQDLADEENGIAIFEVPLLFESGLHEKMDHNIVVSSTEENRIQRVMERDNLTREQVLSRIHAQMPEEEKLLMADSILFNDGSADDLHRQVDALYEMLKAGGTRA